VTRTDAYLEIFPSREESVTVFKRLHLRGVLLAATVLASPLITAVPTRAAGHIAIGLSAAPTRAAGHIAIGLSVRTAPPMLPIYAQPPIPAPGYIWTPGYWHWRQAVNYYWVPGTWVQPPTVGVLWTPPWWGWSDDGYVFHDGYWGPHVGYYGGVNYGFGYGGVGYEGGHWEGQTFAYNRSVNNFGSVRVANVYEKPATVLNTSHVSYVGGDGGLRTEPTAEERLAEHDQHVAVTAVQARHISVASRVPALAASRNNGVPAIAATSHPAQFRGPGVVHLRPTPAVAHGPMNRDVAHPAPHPAAAGPAHPPGAAEGHAAKAERAER